MNYISTHAKRRFKERYNINIPSIEYLMEVGIKQDAINKNGKIVNNKNRGIYRTVYDNKIIEYVMSIHKNGDICVCTFNEPPKNLSDVCYTYKKEG